MPYELDWENISFSETHKVQLLIVVKIFCLESVIKKVKITAHVNLSNGGIFALIDELSRLSAEYAEEKARWR